MAACILGYFIKKYDLLRFMDGWFKKKPENLSSVETAEDADGNDGNANENPLYGEENADGAPLETAGEALNTSDENHAADEKDETFSAAASDEKRIENSDRFSQLIRHSLESEKTSGYEEDIKFSPPQEKTKKTEKPPKPVAPAPEEIAAEYEGKWRIVRSGNTFVAELYDDSDELLMRSDHYANYAGAKKAVEMLKKYVKGNSFTIAVKDEKFLFKLFTPSGRLVCAGEPCETRNECQARIEKVKRVAFKAEIVRG
ncbi:MAG: hypothetical protein J6Z34_04475 [Clostridia bacterium]|nr:hypothetical protein [Clostridia bacterium]